MMPLLQPQKHISAMKTAADQAADLLIKRFGHLQKKQIKAKALNDFVTVVDKESQKKVIRSLKKAYPSYGVRAEEDGVYEKKERMWVIDPLDGTSNYIHQFPMFCISIGLTENDVPIAGLVYDPLHKEYFSAVRGQGAFLNRKKISVSRVSKLKNAFLATGFPFRAKKHFEPYHQSFRYFFYRSSGIRRGGSAALDLCYTACGRFDGFWELGLSVWDMAAGALIVEEAGGAVSDFAGNGNYLINGNIVASNKRIHTSLVKPLKGIRRFREITS